MFGWPTKLRKQEEWEMTSFGRKIATAGVVIVVGTSLSGCATKDWVNEQIAPLSARLTALEARVQQVDQTAQQANATAQSAAGAAQSANQRLDQLTPRVDALEQRLARKGARN